MPDYTVNEDGTLTIVDETSQRSFKPQPPPKQPRTLTERLASVAKWLTGFSIGVAVVLAIASFAGVPDFASAHGMEQERYEQLVEEDSFAVPAQQALDALSDVDYGQKLSGLISGIGHLLENFGNNLSATYNQMIGEDPYKQADEGDNDENNGDEAEELTTDDLNSVFGNADEQAGGEG